MKFTIDKTFLCSETIRKSWGIYDNIPIEELTHEQLIKMIKGEDRCTSLGSADHPEFSKLRLQLGSEGFIRIQTNSWNGDRVLIPFTLNGWKFKKDNKFPCAEALRNSIDCAIKFKRKHLSL